MVSVLALARTDGFGLCCSHLISMLQILNEVFTDPFVLQSAALHIRGQLGAGPDMPIWHSVLPCSQNLQSPISGPLLDGSSKCGYTALQCSAQGVAEAGVLHSRNSGEKNAGIGFLVLGNSLFEWQSLAMEEAPEMWMIVCTLSVLGMTLDPNTIPNLHCLMSHTFIEHLLCKFQFKIFISLMWNTHCPEVKYMAMEKNDNPAPNYMGWGIGAIRRPVQEDP